MQGLTLSVSGLSQRVAENQRLFEENMRLKDVVLDLECRLRENNQKTTDLSALRNALEKKFGPVDLPIINPIPISIYCNGSGNANSSVTTSANKSGGKDSKKATSKSKVGESGQFSSLISRILASHPSGL